MAITKHDNQELDQIFSDHGEHFGGRKEDYFACLHLTNKFKCSVFNIGSQVCFGNNDYGIDAYHIDRETKNLYLYQFKWSESHNLFKDSLERLTKDGMERIFGNSAIDPIQADLLVNLRSDLYENQSLVERVMVQFVFKGDLEAAENSEGLRYLRENLENKEYLVQKFFGRNVPLTVEFLTDQRSLPKPAPQNTFTLELENPAKIMTADGSKVMYVGFVPLMDLCNIFRLLGQTFLNRNIRSGLSPENSPNKKIREALGDIIIRETLSPDVFSFNHNGVTLAAEHLSFENNHAVVKVPRLLNGAQTITSVARFLEDHQGHPSLASNDEKLNAIRVLAKIIIDDPSSDFVSNITINTNRQNPVEPWHLRANDKIQCDFQDKFREEVHLFYSRQENAIRNLLQDDLDNMGIVDSRDIRIRPLAQTFLAAQGEIPKMSKLPDLFENQKDYEATFRDSYLKADARKIVLAYKIHLVLSSPMERLEERAPKKITYALSRARNLVWALLTQGILNDPSINDQLNEYGNSLTREANFRDYLKDLASTKLLPVLKDVLNDKGYQQKMAQENYEFLRTKEVFKRCMDAAYTRFGWAKKSF
jgi:hypothetical protein